MAIVSQPFNRADADRRVRHPLQTIRGQIRRYVLSEGIALAVLYTAVCLWLGLAVDFALWWAFSFDWLYTFNELTGNGATIGLRAVILVLALAGLVALISVKIFRRLFKEFSDAAVAMLLERRYPKELGDRLITAVELADPKMAQQYGYSQAMVDATIRDAATRVEKLPVHELFRWGKLRVKLALAFLATVGLFALVGGVWCAVNAAPPRDFVIRFGHTASIWGERNLLLMDSYWPPSTLIELVRFPAGELRVPRDEDRPDIKARAVRWVIADSGPEAPRGWRALRFEDLPQLLPKEMLDVKLPEKWSGWVIDLDDFDLRVPAGTIPPEWRWQGATSGHIRTEMAKDEIKEVLDRGDKKASVRTALVEMLNWRNWTVDKIELRAELHRSRRQEESGRAPPQGRGRGSQADRGQRAARDGPHASRGQASLRQVSGHAGETGGVGRRSDHGAALRKLRDPEEGEVAAVYKGQTSDGVHICTPVENRKYLFPLAKLRESCQIRIASSDYETPWRQIRLTPPPVIDMLRIDKDEPAYLYYRMLENPALLKGKRQSISSISISTTGPYSKVLVPAGTDVTIVGRTDRLLADIRIAEPEIKKREEKTSITLPARVDLGEDRKFTCQFKDVSRTIEFDFEFKDQDGVRGSRRIIIMPLEDQPPRINELSLALQPRLFDGGEESARELAAGPRWVITPDAYMRMRGKIEDDHGLSKLQYKYEIVEVDFQNLTAEPVDKSGEPTAPDPRKSSRGMGAPLVLGGMQFGPGPTAYPLLAASYYGGLVQVVKEGALPPPPPRIDLVALQRAKQRLEKQFTWEATPPELDRLLTIQPASRKLLLEALTFQADKRKLESFVLRLTEANQKVGFLRKSWISPALAAGARARASAREARGRLDKLAVTDPAEALARVLEVLKADPAQLEASRALLDKESERAIIARYDLQDEDGVMGFDVRDKLGFIKAIGSTAIQKHYVMRLSIVASDNNVSTGPGVTTAPLPYGFLIVAENEILFLMMRDQRKYHDLLNAQVQEMEKARGNLEGQLIDYRKNPEEPTKLLVRGDAARKALRDGGITAKAIFGKYESLLSEMTFNRMKKDRIDKVRDRIAMPLAR